MTSTSACPRAACLCASRVDPAFCQVSRGVLAGDVAALHREHRVTYLKYVRSRGLSFHDAEEVVDEAFLALHRARRRLAASANPEAFAFKVVKDALADHCRSRDRSRETLQETGIDRRSPDETDGLLLGLDLRRALDELPLRQGDCMRLFALLDQDVRTIARFLGITPSAVTSHLSLARAQLTERLMEEGA